jgi:hypothetical protein
MSYPIFGDYFLLRTEAEAGSGVAVWRPVPVPRRPPGRG